MLVNTNLLYPSLAVPQSIPEYIQEVLIPETGIRLIQEDFNSITVEEARKIMLDSIKFGDYLYDIENEE
jgi:hypothetical protein